MKLWLKILGGLFVFCVATVVAVISVLMSLDYNQFKGIIDQKVEEATGRSLSIDGDLQLDLSLNPTISVRGVRFANADWGADVPMVSLDQLDAKIALWPLLSGRLEIDNVVLNDLRVVLETNGQGRANWEFTPAAPGVASSSTTTDQILAFNPQVSDVRLRNVHLSYRDGATGRVIETDLNRADFSAANFTSPLKGHLQATYNGIDLDVQTILGSLEQLVGREGKPFPVQIKVSAPGLTADIIGNVEQPSQGMAIDGRVSANVRDSSILNQLLGIGLPKIAGIDLIGRVNGQGTRYGIKGLDLKFGQSGLSGAVEFDLSNQRPRIVADVSSNVLDVKSLIDAWPSGAKVNENPDRLFSHAPLPFDVMLLADADLKLDLKKVIMEGVNITDVVMDATLQAGKLVAERLNLTVEDGRILARLTLDGAAKAPKLDAHASVRGLNAGALAAMAGQGNVLTLALDGEVNLTSAGSSVQAMMAGLNGYSRFVGRNGRLNDKRLEDLTASLGSVLPWVSNKDANAISCVLADTPIENGNAVAQTVVMDTNGVTVQVTGNVDLPGELLHLTVITNAKKTSLASFSVPVRIKGSLTKPRIDVNPGDVVVGTVGNIVKTPAKLITNLLSDTLSLVKSEKQKKEDAAKDDPCIGALAGGKTTPAPTQAKDAPGAKTEPPADPAKSSGNPLKDAEKVGKALKELF